MTTSLMKSLVNLQLHLNRVYSEAIYGRSAKSLTNDEREALEIVFQVDEGSSQILADLSGFFTELGKNAMEKMSGKQVVVTVLGAAAIWGGVSGFGEYTAHIERMQESEHRRQLESELIKQQPKLMEIQNEQTIALTNILKSVLDATQVDIAQATFNRGQLEEVTRNDRVPTELKRIDDLYLVSSLRIKADSYRIELMRVSDNYGFHADLQKGSISMSEVQQITTAFAREEPILINVVARTKGELVTSANIVGVSNKANGDQIANLGD
tara:strand:- start:18958 stop:19761 length:804 start_codon:yes stop_codon:yes gene_type:complete